MRHRKRRRTGTVRCAIRLLLVSCSLVLSAASARAQGAVPAEEFLPVIDAHSQIREGLDLDEAVRLLREGKVSRAILSSRFPWTSAPRPDPDPVLALASRYPDLIVPAIGTKGGDYRNGSQDWDAYLRRQGAVEQFRAIAELHIFHEEKSANAPEVFVMPSDPRVSTALAVAKKRGWPLVLHVEFPNLSGERRPKVLAELKNLMRTNPDQPFVLIHMALLQADDVEALIRDHPNVHFMTSHTINNRRTRHNFISVFENFSGPNFKEQWRRLFVAHPDRFVLGFDNVSPAQHWNDSYLKKIAAWRRALSQLPRDAAHAIAHGNAERLWHLAPAR